MCRNVNPSGIKGVRLPEPQSVAPHLHLKLGTLRLLFVVFPGAQSHSISTLKVDIAGHQTNVSKCGRATGKLGGHGPLEDHIGFGFLSCTTGKRKERVISSW